MVYDSGGGDAMPPSKLAHIVFQTNRIKELRDWYCAVLEGQVIYENPHLSFVSYDDEHHRVAFVDFAPLTARDPQTELMVKSSEQPGLHHVAFTFASMGGNCSTTTCGSGIAASGRSSASPM